MKVTSIEKNLGINYIFMCQLHFWYDHVCLTERQAHVHMLENGDWKQPTASWNQSQTNGREDLYV